MADRELEKNISEYKKIEKWDKLLTNPLTKILINNVCPFIAPGLDSAINEKLQKKQFERLAEICDIIISDDNVTTKKIEDVEDILSFAKMYDVARKLITNDKVDYLARLYKNLIVSEDKNYDVYEEYLQRLGELSFKELEILHILDKVDLVIEDLRMSPREPVNEEIQQKRVLEIEKKWIEFQENILCIFGIDRLDLEGYMMGISRSGFCVKFNVFQTPKRTNSIYGVTNYYRNFAKMIYK